MQEKKIPTDIEPESWTKQFEDTFLRAKAELDELSRQFHELVVNNAKSFNRKPPDVSAYDRSEYLKKQAEKARENDTSKCERE